MGNEERKAEGKIALEASGVRKVYRKDGREMPVLDVASFVAREGEFITIIGPSGCGKSTFLHIMGGFIPAEAGAIRVYGNAVGAGAWCSRNSRCSRGRRWRAMSAGASKPRVSKK